MFKYHQFTLFREGRMAPPLAWTRAILAEQRISRSVLQGPEVQTSSTFVLILKLDLGSGSGKHKYFNTRRQVKGNQIVTKTYKLQRFSTWSPTRSWLEVVGEGSLATTGRLQLEFTQLCRVFGGRMWPRCVARPPLSSVLSSGLEFPWQAISE